MIMVKAIPGNRQQKRRILYYPTIDIPSGKWLRQAILYWDEIASIIPKDYDGNLLLDLSHEVRYLMDEGEFTPIRPEDLVFHRENRDAFGKFGTEFISLISDPSFPLFIRRSHASNSGERRPQVRSFSRIHFNKVSDLIYWQLEDRGLARRTQDHQWIEMETTTALLYMSLLAKHLAAIQKDLTRIGTIMPIYEKMNFKRVTKGKGYPVVSLNLTRLLPTPQENIPFEKIIDFKRKRRDNLIRFRKILLDYQKQISKAESPYELKELTSDFSEELIIGINDLKSAMTSDKIGARIKSIRSLINFQSAPTLVAGGALAADAFNILPSSIAVPVAITSGAIELGFNFIENRIEESRNFMSPLFPMSIKLKGRVY